MDETQGNAPDEGSPSLCPLRLWMQPAGLMIELTEADNLVGRHSTADVRLPLPDVSRRHCRFVYASGRWQVRDLNSLNGVYVNEERVVEQTDLRDGDQVRLGGFTFAVELPKLATDEGLVRRLFPGRPNITYRSQHRRAS
jgi:pSer/pThr/pTyr-binding forkhead associated (FHA) protein